MIKSGQYWKWNPDFLEFITRFPSTKQWQVLEGHENSKKYQAIGQLTSFVQVRKSRREKEGEKTEKLDMGEG